MTEQWLVIDLNPEPWAVGPLTVSRSKANGKMIPVMGRNQELWAYQQAIKAMTTEAKMMTGKVRLTAYLWHKLEAGFVGGGKRATRDNRPDATNMLKATEDALQGILYENDTDNYDVRAVIVERSAETSPCIVIHVEPWYAFDPDEIPMGIWAQIEELQTRDMTASLDDNSWGGN